MLSFALAAFIFIPAGRIIAAPTIGIAFPNASRTSGSTTVSGTASTSAGSINKVEIRVRRDTGLIRYLRPSTLSFDLDPNTEDIDTAWFKATSSNAWLDWQVSSGTFVSGGQYTFNARSLDSSGS